VDNVIAEPADSHLCKSLVKVRPHLNRFFYWPMVMASVSMHGVSAGLEPGNLWIDELNVDIPTVMQNLM
jgi:hypothetical protein